MPGWRSGQSQWSVKPPTERSPQVRILLLAQANRRPRIRLPRFASERSEELAKADPGRSTFCRRGSVAEHLLGKEKVMGSIPIVGSFMGLTPIEV